MIYLCSKSRETIKQDFETAYVAFIHKYTKSCFTPKERKTLNDVMSKSATPIKNIDDFVQQCRSVDQNGWLLHKCKFVEKYMQGIKRSSKCEIENTSRTLCQVNNLLHSGMDMYCGIPAAAYEKFVHSYQYTEQEKKHAALENATPSSSITEKEDLLALVSGVDVKGWLYAKSMFLQPYLDFNNVTDTLADCILEVLQNVRGILQHNISVPPKKRYALKDTEDT
jgi:hypothetical protein